MPTGRVVVVRGDLFGQFGPVPVGRAVVGPDLPGLVGERAAHQVTFGLLPPSQQVRAEFAELLGPAGEELAAVGVLVDLVGSGGRGAAGRLPIRPIVVTRPPRRMPVLL